MGPERLNTWHSIALSSVIANKGTTLLGVPGWRVAEDSFLKNYVLPAKKINSKIR